MAEEPDREPDWDLDDDTLRRTGSVKWNHYPPDVLPAWVAEMDVRMAGVIRAALDEALDRGQIGYLPPDGDTALPQACAAFLARRFGWQVDPGRVVLCGDVMAGVQLVLQTLCEPGPVVVPTPAYPPFLDVPAITGRAAVLIACTGGELDVEAIDAALADGARTVLLSNPHNPLGRAFTATELAALRDVAAARGARVISDEIHAPLVLDGAAHLPYASLAGTADHVTTVLAATKAWNCPGLKCAQIIAGNPADLATLRSLPLVANHGASSLGVAATVAAYTAGEPWLDGVLAHLSDRRAQFGSLLAQHLPQLTFTPMEATYLAWVDARGTGLADPAKAALDHGRVMPHPGQWFGPGYEGFVRVNLATSAERLDRIVAGLARAWGENAADHRPQ